MPPSLASILCIGFLVYLFRRDFNERPNVTSALWLPFLWVFISGSRFLSGWLAVFGLNLGPVSVEEGSPIDALFFFVLIASGIFVLIRRRVSVAEFFTKNRWVTIYLLYCLLAISWSEYSFVGFKRWIKLFGQPVMVLVLLTEPDPMESMSRLFKRCAYVFMPVSVLFIKYYADLGRAFDIWTGQPMNTGITTNKNTLGCDCLIIGLFYAWHLMRVLRQEKGTARNQELFWCVFFLALTFWVLHEAQSSTSLGAMLLAIFLVWVLGSKYVDPRRAGAYLLTALLVFGVTDAIFGVHEVVIQALGRNTTLTGRTDIWQLLIHWNINPWLGVGFESFWLGVRVDQLANLLPGLILNEAHNGYLETYLNLGLVGLAITVIMLMATFFKIQRALQVDFDFARLRLGYLVAFIFYNWTEAAFRTHSVPFFMFFLIAIDYSARPFAAEIPAGNEAAKPGPDLSGLGKNGMEATV